VGGGEIELDTSVIAETVEPGVASIWGRKLGHGAGDSSLKAKKTEQEHIREAKIRSRKSGGGGPSFSRDSWTG